MVSARKLLLMLHCKRTYRTRPRARSSQSEERGTGSPPQVLELGTFNKIRIKSLSVLTGKERNVDTTCRVCLREGRIPILGDDLYNNVSRDLFAFTGVEVQENDEHPKHLCENCYSLLQGAIQLRSTAQSSQQILLDRINSDNDSHHLMEDHDYTTFQKPQTYQNSTYSDINFPERFRCTKCMLVFDNEQAFHEHNLSEAHENFKKPCPECGKEFDDASRLRTHLKYHRLSRSVQLKPKLPCPECGKEFNARAMISHMRYHSKKVIEICDVCGKEFTVKGHYTSHRKIHSLELPYKCTWCPYRCRFKYTLTVHLRTHTGEKPYQCELCPDKAFIHKGNLNAHMLTHKLGHDFVCDICQKGYNYKQDLEDHFKAKHLGLKEHVCDVCDEAFGLRTQLDKHKRRVHRKEKLRGGKAPLYLKEEYQKVCVDKENTEN